MIAPRSAVGIIIGVVILVTTITLLLAIVRPDLLRTQIFAPKDLRGTIDSAKLSEGSHTIEVIARTADGTQVTTGAVPFRVTRDTEAIKQNRVLLPDRQGRPTVEHTVTVDGDTIRHEAERDVRLSGNPQFSSTKFTDGPRTVVSLARPRLSAVYTLQLPQHTYLVQAVLKHDAPGPVEAIFSVNGRGWKKIVLGKNDDSYELRTVGLLRDFDQGTLGVRLGKDSFTCEPQDLAAGDLAHCDRNLFLDEIRFIPVS